MIAEQIYRLAKSRRFSGLLERLVKAAIYAPPGAYLAVTLISRLDRIRRRAAVLNMVPRLGRRSQHRLFVAARRLSRRRRHVAALEVYWLVAAKLSRPRAAMAALFSDEADRIFDEHRDNANLALARAWAAYEVGRFRLATEHFDLAAKLDPEAMTLAGSGLAAAFAATQLRDSERATQHLAREFGFLDPLGNHSPDALAEAFDRRGLERAVGPLLPPMLADRLSDRPGTRYGIFFLSSTEALGHAILDPYYFLALRKSDYDRIFMLGPPKSAYRPASATCLRIVEKYADYVEITDPALLNFSWMSVGTKRFGQLDLVIEHYWSLLREAVHRTRDRADPFVHNAWHMSLPDSMVWRGERFCEQIGVDLDRPLVVLHARHSTYHGLAKQSFRDANIKNYEPSIHHLLSEGHQVVRIGDRAMPQLRIRHRDYLELPFARGYHTELDPFLVSRSRFMIGCQSGPCAYARVLGVPLLSINAVLHYTLLPAPMEMACFKRYHRAPEQLRGRPAKGPEISLDQVLKTGVSHFENSYQFEQAGVTVADARPEEILAAVKDMIAWTADPELPLTDEQRAFAEQVEETTQKLAASGSALDLPLADYLGIALPGYRLSPTVARMRLEAEPATGERLP